MWPGSGLPSVGRSRRTRYRSHTVLSYDIRKSGDSDANPAFIGHLAKECPLDRQSEEELQVEVAATNMAITQAIGGLTALSGDQRPFIARILAAGLRELDNADYRSIAPEHRAAFLSKVRARYIELVTTVDAE